MAEQAPDYTITSNPHVFLHCGPVATQDVDDGRDLTVITSSSNESVHYKNGVFEEYIHGHSAEVVGINGDPTQIGRLGKVIIAKTGDIVLNAESGNIHLVAKNIFFEASAGEEGQGNIMAECNGFLRLSTGGEFRVAAGRMCFRSEGGINFVGDVRISGDLFKGSAVASADMLKSLLAGDWANIINGISESCK